MNIWFKNILEENRKIGAKNKIFMLRIDIKKA